MTLQGKDVRLVRWRHCVVWTMLLTATSTMGSGGTKSRPTRVPGSEHLVLRREFPYEFWRASPRPYTPLPPDRRSSETTNYGYFYGEARDEADIDPDSWQILPIQIPDDLVGDLDFWTQRTTTEVPPYPTSPTPQYGRHPGVTEPPHLFHPERLYVSIKNSSEIQASGSSDSHGNPNRTHTIEEKPTLVASDTPPQSQYPSLRHPPNRTKKLDLFSSWTQSLREQLKPYIDTTGLPKLPTLPRLPKLPSINRITRFPKLSVWPMNVFHDTPKLQVERDSESNITDPGEHMIHKFYSILSGTYPPDQSNKKLRKHKRPNYLYPPNHQNYPSNHFSPTSNNQNYPSSHFSPTRENQNHLNSHLSPSSPYNTRSDDQNYYSDHSSPSQHLPDRYHHPLSSSAHQGTRNHENFEYEENSGIKHEGSSTDDHFPLLPNRNHPVRDSKRPYGSQSQPPRNFRDSQHRRQGIHQHPADEQYSHMEGPVEVHGSTWKGQITGDVMVTDEGQYHPMGNQRRPIKDESRPEDDQYYHADSQQPPNIDDNWHPEGSNNQVHSTNPILKIMKHPTNQRNPPRSPYQNRPSRPLNPSPNRIFRRGPYQSFGSRPHYQVHDYYPTTSDDWTDHLTHPLFAESYSDVGIIERLTNLDSLSSSFVIPGGLVVIALALAVYYFTYVWYPTPVVTAKVVKLFSDSENLLNVDQQKAIREVYEVFRSLEVEYKQDPELWSSSCKSRLVCQVHQELPGLWQVTRAYGAFVRSSLATGPEGNDNFTLYLKAAQQGSSGSNCETRYPACLMAPIPVRSTLQKLLGIPQDDYPEVVYT